MKRKILLAVALTAVLMSGTIQLSFTSPPPCLSACIDNYRDCVQTNPKSYCMVIFNHCSALCN